MGALLDLFFPPRCSACDAVLEAAAVFCTTCALAVEPVPEPQCHTCAEPRTRGPLCPRCRQRPPPFSRTVAAWVHEGPVARAIHRFKYEDCPGLAGPLGEALAGVAGALPLTEDTRLVPVPLHAARFRARRYDQAALLAAAAGRRLGLDVAWNGLRRTRATRRQVGLSDVERDTNLAGAFKATGSFADERLILVDDVVTTGATARAAAAALRSAGAAEVWVLVLARATDAL